MHSDLDGIKLGILRQRELLGFVKRFVSMMSSHYPQRSYKTLVINSPGWFNALFKLLSPLLRESTKQKMTILSRGKSQDAVLKEVLTAEVVELLPPSVWSDFKKTKQPTQMARSSSTEDDLRQFCLSRLQEAGLEMVV